jgi:hypothetical protein
MEKHQKPSRLGAGVVLGPYETNSAQSQPGSPLPGRVPAEAHGRRLVPAAFLAANGERVGATWLTGQVHRYAKAETRVDLSPPR